MSNEASAKPAALDTATEDRASAIVKRLEELWALEEEESAENHGLFHELCELLGEQEAFHRVTHFAN